MRRTDFPQGVPGGFGVASFVWDATEDGPLPGSLGVILRGEIPLGSVLIGGFLHISKVLVGGSTDLHLGGVPPATPGTVLTSPTPALPAGFSVLNNGVLADPTKNFVVDTETKSRILAYSTAPVTAGQFALYLFYVNNDLGEFGQAKTPTLYKRSKSPVALPSEIKVASFVWDRATDGPMVNGVGQYMRGEIPVGSVVIGGYVHATTVLSAQVALHLGGVVPATAGVDIYSGVGLNTAIGFYALATGSFANPTLNTPVNTVTDSRIMAYPLGDMTAGTFALYLFYVTNQVGVYGNLGERRRTESPEARPGEMRLATFTWDATEDGTILTGVGQYMRGEVPVGSVIVGGFVHTSKTLVSGADLNLHLGGIPPGTAGTVLKLGPGPATPLGFSALDWGVFSDPTKNILVTTERYSRVMIYASSTTTAGQFTLYLFYINNELGLHGQIANPHSSQIT